MNVLGLDIGGTGIKGAIVDTKSGTLITERLRIKTPQPATPEAVIETATGIIKEFNWNGPVGVGFPAAVVNEVVMTASNIDTSWIGLNAAKKIEDASGCAVHLLNDVDAAGYAEMRFGAGKDDTGIILMAAFGTGIGTAIFQNRVLLPNTEFGHIMINGQNAESFASNATREAENLSWEEWGGRVSEYLNRLTSLVWVDKVIMGGGVSKHFELYEDYLKTNISVEPAKLRNHAGIIGAAISAEKEFLV